MATKKFSLDEVLDQVFIRKLHTRMFQETWQWAGKFRRTEKNIGVDPLVIFTEIKKLTDDVNFQVKNQIYSVDEMVTRFHHRLVSIHPFANGNGRHARLMSDILLKSLGSPLFSWGATSLRDQTEIRLKYIEALRAADKHDYKQLLIFVRS